MTSANTDLEAALGPLRERMRNSALKHARRITTRHLPTSREVTRRWHGKTVHVEVTHPQFGPLHRGYLCPARTQRPDAAVVWRISDYDAHDLGEYAGDYVDAERLLLDATTELDQITTDTQGD